jgi:hypothetical protein
LLDDLNVNRSYIDQILYRFFVVFAILLQLGAGSDIDQFVNENFLDDKRLPFESQDEVKWPKGCHATFKDFYQLQWEYCVLAWEEEQLCGNSLRKDGLLPIIGTEEFCVGSTNSKTFKIMLHTEYNKLNLKVRIILFFWNEEIT